MQLKKAMFFIHRKGEWNNRKRNKDTDIKRRTELYHSAGKSFPGSFPGSSHVPLGTEAEINGEIQILMKLECSPPSHSPLFKNGVGRGRTLEWSFLGEHPETVHRKEYAQRALQTTTTIGNNEENWGKAERKAMEALEPCREILQMASFCCRTPHGLLNNLGLVASI